MDKPVVAFEHVSKKFRRGEHHDSLRDLIPRIYESLRPGGRVVVEAFHRDATKTTPIGGAVVFDTNELLKLYSQLRVLRYEDVEAKNDFGRDLNRAVRLLAQKEPAP